MIQNNNFTYNGLLNILESFASEHIDVRRFIAEDLDQMSEMTSKDEQFPVMFVTPTNNIFDWHINQYEVRIYVYDRLIKDRTNINDIRSKTNQIISDLDVWLRKEAELPIEVTSISTSYPFSSELMTDVTGWYVDVVVDIPSYETCNIPFLNEPVITGYTCDILYSNNYLTCLNVLECDTLTDYIADEIQEAISGITTENTFVTGGTFSQDTLILERNDGEEVIVTGFTYENTVITGFTYDNNNTLTISDSQGSEFEASINQMSGLTINGNLDVDTIDQVDSIDFNTSAVSTSAVGRLKWNNTDGTLDLGLKGGSVTLQLGQEQIIRVVNKTNTNLLESEYKVVRVRTQAEGGAQGQRLAVKLAQADTKAHHSGVLGLVTENINNNQEGFITTFGHVRGINTTGSLQGETWLDGDILWLSEIVPGGLTNIEPSNHPVQMGYVEYAHANNGKLFVKVEEGVTELHELHDVNLSGTTDGQVLTYENGVWINKTPISPSSSLTVGSTQILSGTTGRILFQSGTTLQQSSNLFWDVTNSRLAVGSSNPQARLDVRAQGALSTDLAFRIRNNADTINLLDVRGNGSINTNNNGTNRVVFINSTGLPSSFTERSVVINSNDTGGVGRPFNVLINASDNTGSFVGGRTYINTDSTVATRVWIGNLAIANSGGVYAGDGLVRLGTNISTGTNDVTIGHNMAWPGGGDSTGMWAIGNNLSGIVNDHKNAFVFGINRKDLVIGGGKGNLGVGGFNPTSRAETNTIFQISGTAPVTSIVDGYQQYSADRGGVGGKAAAHFRSEDGTINVIGDLSGFGSSNPQARLDVRAQGNLSTDIALRVRDNTDTVDLMKINLVRSDFYTNSGVFFKTGLYSEIAMMKDGNSAVLLRGRTTSVGTSFELGAYEFQGGYYGRLSLFKNNGSIGVNIAADRASYLPTSLYVGGPLPSVETGTNWIGVKNGISPSGQTDSFQLYSADRGGIDGRASAHFRSEDGTINVIGNLSSFGSSNPQARLDVRAQGALSTDVVFRVRNNADDTNLLDVRGNGTMNFTSVSGPITFTEGTVGGFGQGIVFKRGTNSATFSLDNSSVLNLNTGGMNINSNGGAIVLNGGPSGGAFFQSVDLRGNGNQSVRINSTGQCVFGPSTTWYNGDGGYTYTDRVIVDRQSMAFRNATTIPTTTLDSFKFYSADITAGNAAPHFQTENGRVVKLYQQVEAALVNTANTGDANTDALIEALKTIIINVGLGAAI